MASNARLISAKDAAAYLGIAPKTFWEWVNRGIVPQVKLKGAKPKYDIRDIDRIIEENKSFAPAAIMTGAVLQDRD